MKLFILGLLIGYMFSPQIYCFEMRARILARRMVRGLGWKWREWMW
jgi:hypothetical protein